jgi:hypothetical protein
MAALDPNPGNPGQDEYEGVIDFAKDQLNECSLFFSGTCWQRPSPGRGYIIWSVSD